jgi:hypothetical protein
MDHQNLVCGRTLPPGFPVAKYAPENRREREVGRTMYFLGLLCFLVGLACIAAGRQIATRPDRLYSGTTRGELRALARAGVIVAGVFLSLAGAILFLVALKS